MGLPHATSHNWPRSRPNIMLRLTHCPGSSYSLRASQQDAEASQPTTIHGSFEWRVRPAPGLRPLVGLGVWGLSVNARGATMQDAKQGDTYLPEWR